MAGELHVVALSGGKDSTAMALRLSEMEPKEYTYVCTPTGRELPEMVAHWRRLERLLGVPIVKVHGGDLFDLIRRMKCIPNFRFRFCTRILKIQTYSAWLMRQVTSSPRLKVITYVGLRADEDERNGADFSGIPNIKTDFPMRRWGWNIGDVIDYIRTRGIAIPDRTDCDICFFQRLSEWYRLWKLYPERWRQGEAIENEVGHTFRTPGRDTWPTSMKELRIRFERGDIPTKSIVREDSAKICRVCTL